MRYRAHMEHAPESIFVYDHNQQVFIDVNQNAGLQLGMHLATLIVMPPSRLYEHKPSEPLTQSIK